MVSFALPLASYFIATRDLDRAFRSMCDLVIRSTKEKSVELTYFSASTFCWNLLQTNILITRYCQLKDKKLLYFEEIYSGKGSYPDFESFSQRENLETLFDYLKSLAEDKICEQ